MSPFASTLRSSGSSDSSAGSAYQLILDHVLTYPGSFEIPLRTMYTLNCAPRARAHSASSQASPPSSTSSSPNMSQTAFPDSQTTQTFTENLMAQISQLPSQPSSLPPSFITSFVIKCFPEELILVDFPQALTGLDYLKDLETRRRREVASTMQRLDINADALKDEANNMAARSPAVTQWVKAIEEKERKVEALYTQLYIGLRRWILINEMSLQPYNRHNCVAMLNTLHPPVMQVQPTSKLTPDVIKGQRDGFFKYIQSVEKQGPRCLNTLMQLGKGANDSNGWPAVTKIVHMYLQVATSIINECMDINDATDLPAQKNRNSKQSRHGRKADSGISFTSDKRASVRNSNGEPVSPVEIARPKTPSGSRSSTALEKLARGLMTIGRNRTEATELIQDDSVTPAMAAAEKPKMLRKMRSMPSMERNKNNVADAPTFDVESMRRQRMKYEASVVPPPHTMLASET